MNLNNTPSGGALSAADLDAYRQGPTRRPYIAAGLDQQGRRQDNRTEPAEASTDFGMDEATPLEVVGGLLAWVGGILIGLAIMSMALIAAVWP